MDLLYSLSQILSSNRNFIHLVLLIAETSYSTRVAPQGNLFWMLTWCDPKENQLNPWFHLIKLNILKTSILVNKVLDNISPMILCTLYTDQTKGHKPLKTRKWSKHVRMVFREKMTLTQKNATLSWCRW